MVNIFRISFVIVVISFIISVGCADHEALHITRNLPFRTYDHVLMEAYRFLEMEYPSAIACPANSEEVGFNEEKSLGKKSLFVRNIYEGEQTAHDVHYGICENPYEMTVLYHNKNVEFQFGFEVYYDKSKYADKRFSESNRGNYNLITNSVDYINYIKPYFTLLSKIPVISGVSSMPVVSRFLGPTPLYLDAERKKEMGFMWVDSFRMKFNFSAKRVAQTVYGLSLTTRGIHECDNYDLGKEFFNGFDIDELYKEKNQKRMLDGVKLPEKTDENYNEMACESENQCFTKWLSVPDELFHHLAANPISCSDLLTVPIWKSTIHDVLNKLDNFLFTLSLVVGHPSGDLTVHSGVHGVLQLPLIKSSYLNLRSKKSITLGEKDIQVADVIYKLVKYKTKLCGKRKSEDDKNKAENKHSDAEKKTSTRSDESAENDEKTQRKSPECEIPTLSIVVVIHNNPYFNYETEKICDDVCKEWGWELIKQRKLSEKLFTSKYIYCCPADDNDVRKKLGISQEQYTKLEMQTDHNFSLTKFPKYDFDTMMYKFESVYDHVVSTYQHLFKGDKFQKNVYEKMNLLNQHFHNEPKFLLIEEPQNDGDGPDKSEVQLNIEKGKEDPTKDDSDSSGEE